MANIHNLTVQLMALCQLDIDAVIAYEQAMPHIDHPVIRERFEEFLGDHNRHIADLSQQIRDLGETPPERSADFKGFFLTEFIDLRGVHGTEGALSAMDANEKLINRVYGKAMRWRDMVPNSVALAKTNYQDEKKHLEFIEEAIEARVWERAEAVK